MFQKKFDNIPMTHTSSKDQRCLILRGESTDAGLVLEERLNNVEETELAGSMQRSEAREIADHVNADWLFLVLQCFGDCILFPSHDGQMERGRHDGRSDWQKRTLVNSKKEAEQMLAHSPGFFEKI